jgi:hypothetical protein
MIPGVPRKTRINRLILYLLAPLIGALFRLDGLLGLQALRFALLHGSIVRMRLFVVFRARAAEKEQNRLCVPAHAISFCIWRVVVKRTTMSRYAHRGQGSGNQRTD